MRKAFYGCLIVWYACGAAQGKPSATSTDTVHENEPDTSIGSAIPASPNPYFYEERMHVFSNPLLADTFRLTIPQKNTTGTNILFQIISYKGQIIYSEKFPVAALTNDMSILENEAEEEKYPAKRIKDFFSDQSFSKPAVDPQEEFSSDGNFLEQADWEDIHTDTSATGFFYLTEKANGRGIA